MSYKRPRLMFKSNSGARPTDNQLYYGACDSRCLNREFRFDNCLKLLYSHFFRIEQSLNRAIEYENAMNFRFSVRAV